jgi:hypothetical protein
MWQYFLDVGHARAVLDNKVLTELSSGSCFGEMAFLASCNKVLRRKNCNSDLAMRMCDGENTRTYAHVTASHTRLR